MRGCKLQHSAGTRAISEPVAIALVKHKLRHPGQQITRSTTRKPRESQALKD